MRKLRRRYTIAWVLWLTAFLVIEGAALLDRAPGDTLSEHVWNVASVSIMWWLLAGFLVWLTAHLLGPRARRWLETWRQR